MNVNLRKYKNIHEGKRVFIIGNGPSLANTNLDLIKDEYSIAMNRISLLYPKFLWRPTYFLFSSSNCLDKEWGSQWTESVKETYTDKRTKCFIWEKYRSVIDPNNEHSIEWIRSMTEFKPNSRGDIDVRWWPNNIEYRMDKSATTMNLALQIANYMGFSEIIFLGVDLGFVADRGFNQDPNHFSQQYNAHIIPEKVDKINNQMRNVHKLARMKIPARIKMYNASITTNLDIYPRICYSTLLKEKKYKLLNL